MNNRERLELVVNEYCPEEDILIETEDHFIVLDPLGYNIKTDKSDENVQWTIDLLTGNL